MLGCIGAIIGFLVKVAIKVLKYTLPIILVFWAISGGQSAADNATDSGFFFGIEELKEDYEVDVTIHWDNGESDSVITIRRDRHWTIPYDTYSVKGQNDLFTNDTSYDTSLSQVSIPVKEGYRFLGLFASPGGGSMIVSPGGYGLVDLKNDMDLYAMWEAVE